MLVKSVLAAVILMLCSCVTSDKTRSFPRYLNQSGYSMVLSGQRTKESVWQVVDKNKKYLEKCYEQSLQEDLHLNARLAFNFIIADSGDVVFSELQEAQSDYEIDDLSKCFVAQINGWKFERITKGDQTRVYIPFFLDALSHQKNQYTLRGLKFSMKGELTYRRFISVIFPSLEELRACYADARELEKNLKMFLYLDLRFSQDGKLRKAEKSVYRSSGDSEKLLSCIMDKVNNWKVPRLPRGELQVYLPMEFDYSAKSQNIIVNTP
ncbi:MAG: AgmX/PglI C-terminal domain-containing protein [Oligoflexales bacterium]|nr:AgmX/PglI C-terminal domain-containing protein [Oligoflexales bacterium]